jgi:hypothetical protein
VQRELALDAFVGHDAAHREHFAAARTAASDDHTRENLDALFIAFKNLRVHVNRIADRKVRNFRLKARLFDELENLLAHGFILLDVMFCY